MVGSRDNGRVAQDERKARGKGKREGRGKQELKKG